MSNDKSKNNMNSWQHKGVSPILATVVLLGITVVGGGITFAFFSTAATTASVTDVIAIENAQAVKGTSHADLTATIKNAGSQPWTKVEMTVSKSELSEPILYESLHEVVAGCTDSITESNCKDAPKDSSLAAGGRDNPLRAQWLLSLDKTNEDGATNQADFGEGAAAGRKLVFDSKDDYRTIQILNGTAVARLFGQSSTDNPHPLNSAMTECNLSASGTTVNCAATFKELDASTKGDAVWCKGGSTTQRDAGIWATCDVFTHQNIEDDPVSAGGTIYFYADTFTNEIPGLNNQVVRVGDNIVANIFTENTDGGTARVQTIIKVSGI